jgi:Glycosyl transferase family group 2
MKQSFVPTIETYARRFAVRRPYFSAPPPENLNLIIAIPAYKESDIAHTLQSLASCHRPSGKVELIIMVNAPENASAEALAANQATIQQIEQWDRSTPDFLKAYVIREEAIQLNHAGAGMARKMAMDEAVQRWAMINKDGPILCLDADCRVSASYLVEAEKAFADPSIKVSHFHFEHDYHEEADPIRREGIINYELHLRCHIQGLKLAGYPFAIHTVGSCMGVRASAYARAGGMNRRKAGEDFYFLHKLAPLGGWRNVGNATVYPSCRESDRVPFGTGRAQLEWRRGCRTGLSYHAGIYEAMKPVFEILPNAFDQSIDVDLFPLTVGDFLRETNAPGRIAAMKTQANNADAFSKRFWQWMDGFMVLKFTHYLRDHGFPNQPISDVSSVILSAFGLAPVKSKEEALQQFRRLQAQGGEKIFDRKELKPPRFSVKS